MRDDINFNGVSLAGVADGLGCQLDILQIPNINKPVRKRSVYSIDGANGNYVINQSAYEAVTLEYELLVHSKADAQAIANAIAEWADSDGYAVLKDTFDTTHYRLAYLNNSYAVENLQTENCRVTIEFTCKPERYLINANDVSITAKNTNITVTNPTKHTAKPLIKITGGVMPTLFEYDDGEPYWSAPSTFNNEFPVDKRYKIYGIAVSNECELKYSSTHTEAVTFSRDQTTNYPAATGNQVSSVESGWYGVSGLLLPADAKNNYTVSSICKRRGPVADTNPFYFVTFLDSNGKVIKTVKSINLAIGGDFTFTTTASTSHMIIWLGNCNNLPIDYGQIQLNKGAETCDFVPSWVVGTPATVTINGTSCEIFPCPNELYIDCERENVYSGDDNFNRYASFKDTSGNVAECFELNKGTNTVRISGQYLESVVIKPNYWEL